MTGFDQVNPAATVSGEAVFRRFLQIEAAVRRNPKQPDFEGLDVLVATGLDELGGVTTRRFTEWVAEQQKSEAVVLKQNRLWREERDADRKKKKDKGQGDA
eukprot:8494473-Lingulodinium_polyedra.AAC.1